jgi:uncharacterized membrane protein
MEEFIMEVLNVVAIIVAGLMVGCELAIAAFVHPTLDKLPDDVHLPAASALARVLGGFMPFWYILVFLLTFAEVVIQWHQSGRLPIWIATSAVLWMLASLYSVIALCRSTTVLSPLRLPTGRRTGVDGICFTAGVLYSSR